MDRIRSSCHQYWPELDPNACVRLARRAIRGSAGRLLSGAVSDRLNVRPFCLKWCPKANADELPVTHRRLMWWRLHHPELAHTVVEPLDLWLEENVLVMTRSMGEPLSRWFSRRSACEHGPGAQAATYASDLGRWLRALARGHGVYEADVEPMLGADACRRPDGRLTVNARRLLEARIEQGRRALHALTRAGVEPILTRCGTGFQPVEARAGCRCRAASPDRLLSSDRTPLDCFDVDDTIMAFSDEEPAGFIHGDLKPDNVLVHAGSIVVIDWWTTPRVSWPLTDVAVLAGHLRLCADREAAGRFWSRFVEAYFPDGMDERTHRAIGLIAAILGWTLAAELLQRGPGVMGGWPARVLGGMTKRSAATLLRRPTPVLAAGHDRADGWRGATGR